MKAEEYAAAHPKRHRVDPLLGLVRQCSRCLEWWPASSEYFTPSRRGDALNLHSWCKACSAEAKQEQRGALPVQQRVEHAHGGLTHRHFVRIDEAGAIEEHDHR